MTEGYGQSTGLHLILYDGVCGLCNRFVAFVLKHDKRGDFRFAPLQSPCGQSLLRKYDRNPETLDTLYVIANYDSEKAFLLDRALAGLFVLKALGGLWSWTRILRILPSPLLDAGYNMLARNRYRLFGKYDQCMMPSPEHRERFIDV